MQNSRKTFIAAKVHSEYEHVRELPPALAAKQAAAAGTARAKRIGGVAKPLAAVADGADASTVKMIEGIAAKASATAGTSTSLTIRTRAPPGGGVGGGGGA